MLEYGSDSVWPQNNGGHVFKMKQRSTEGDMCRADTAEYCIQHQEQHMIVVLAAYARTLEQEKKCAY